MKKNCKKRFINLFRRALQTAQKCNVRLKNLTPALITSQLEMEENQMLYIMNWIVSKALLVLQVQEWP